MVYILYNPYANNSNALPLAEAAKALFSAEETKLCNLLEMPIRDLAEILTASDKLVLCGGDGTLNRFINDTVDMTFPCTIYLYHAGTGNDFMNDVADQVENHMVVLSPYLDNLPIVTVKGKDYRFINGIGFGIDGVACQVADDMKEKGASEINYAGITVKQLLFHYRCPNASVTVDGVTKEYKRVWLASAMKGRYYGGGMLIAPSQDRMGDKLSCVVLHGGLRLKALLVFASIFKGGHVKHKEMTEIRTGREISVTFDRPTALQIDGETIRDVTAYSVRFPAAVAKTQEAEKETVAALN